MLARLVPEIELFPADERRGALELSVREAMRPSRFMSPRIIALVLYLQLVPLLRPVPWVFFGCLGLSAAGMLAWAAHTIHTRTRRILREKANMCGHACCLNCGYNLAGLDPIELCPECGADCRNVRTHSAAPIPESFYFPELLSFSRPGEAIMALDRACVAAGPLYQHRTAGLASVLLLMGVVWWGIFALFVHDDVREFMIVVVLASVVGVTCWWYNWVRNLVRAELREMMADITRPGS